MIKFDILWSFDVFLYKNYGFSVTDYQREAAFINYTNLRNHYYATK